jgi:predicted phosphoribosyltransferase
MGAISTGGVRVLNDDVVRYLEVPERVIDAITQKNSES